MCKALCLVNGNFLSSAHRGRKAATTSTTDASNTAARAELYTSETFHSRENVLNHVSVRARTHTFSSASACAHSDACSCAHAPRQCFGWQTLSARTARSPQTPRGHAAKRTCWRLAHQANPAAVVRQGTQCKQMLRRSQSLPTFTARLPECIPCYMSSGYKSSHPNFKKFFSEFSVFEGPTEGEYFEEAQSSHKVLLQFAITALKNKHVF